MALSYGLPTAEDIEYLASNLSIEDKREILAQGVGVEWAIERSVSSSLECMSAYSDGKLLCITGLCVEDGLAGNVYPWLLGTTDMQDHPRAVLRWSKLLIARWLEVNPYLTNYVDARHHRAIAWLTHLGASLTYIEFHGVYKRPFYKFSFGSEI